MYQRHAVIGQQVVDAFEIRAVMRHADMLEHADGDDAVELAAQHPAVIDDLEFHPVA